jgi:hypothetical protein
VLLGDFIASLPRGRTVIKGVGGGRVSAGRPWDRFFFPDEIRPTPFRTLYICVQPPSVPEHMGCAIERLICSIAGQSVLTDCKVLRDAREEDRFKGPKAALSAIRTFR